VELMQRSGWYPFDEGHSLGQVGTENGTIVRDEEHGDGARITLERDGYTPFAITCGLYGWMAHTCFFDTEHSAQQAFDAMRLELARILALIPTKADLETGQTVSTVVDAISRFVDEFA